MKEAPVMYLTRYWLSPDGGKTFLKWLEEIHIADVLAQPGVLWARKIALDQADEQHWTSILIVYGFQSRDELNNYLSSQTRADFWREIEVFEEVQRSERIWGEVDFILDLEKL